MFHSILEGSNPPDLPQDINKEMFDAIIQLSEKLNFETITSEELLNFLQGNAKIPERSMMLILDDRRPGTAEDYFLPVLQENGWTATLAWIAADSGENLWTWIERLNATGYFDIQSHGLGQNGHIPITDQMSEAEVRQEIEGSIPVLMEHFGERPLAIIWPGGNYTELGVQVAREAGFELGFTVHSRGPLMFNWIPQGEKERGMGEPFMTLPRFWDTAALLNLEQTVQISDAAREFARENYAEEAAWYAENCSGELPPLEAVLR